MKKIVLPLKKLNVFSGHQSKSLVVSKVVDKLWKPFKISVTVASHSSDTKVVTI